MLLLGALGACTPAAVEETDLPAIQPTLTVSPTPTPPQPDTALEAALAKFDEYQTYTVAYTQVYESGTYETTHFIQSSQYVNTNTAATLIDSSSETLKMYTYQKLCVGEQCYKTDATGLFKPSSGHYYPPKPALNFLDLDVDHLLANGYTYIGEEMKDGHSAFKYQVQASEAQMNNPDLKLVEPYPEIYFYVDADSGNLLEYDYVYHTTYGSAVDHFQISYSYSGWNESDFTQPEVVEAGSTEWQTYDGIFASAVTFEFPKVDILDETNGIPTLKTPSGARMDFNLFATIATLTMLEDEDEADASLLCGAIFKEFILAFDTTGATLDRAEWVKGPNYYFCKAIINTNSRQEARYLFNEPNEITQRSGRLLPQTFYITVTPAEGEDVDTVFWDVIQTIQLGPGTE